MDPKVLLLDEPTANLDPENVALIERVVTEARRERGMSVIWVTHHLFQARRLAEHAIVLMGGRVVEAGPARAVFESPRTPRARDFLRGDFVW
jgi:tungstate transport system ATP-binding protein